MNLILPLLVVLVVTAALLSLAMDLATAATRKSADRRKPQQIPADDLIGKRLRDAR